MRSISFRYPSIAPAVGLTLLTCLAMQLGTDSAPGDSAPRYHPGAVKGQTLEMEVPAPPTMVKMTFRMQGIENLVDTAPPFRFSIDTTDLRPAKSYKWHTSAMTAPSTCCEMSSWGGAIQIYPLPRLKAPRVSALVVAGTARVVGLVVSRVGPNRVVRAWRFPKRVGESDIIPLALSLRQKQGNARVYRFPGNSFVSVGKRTEIDVEVAPRKRTLRHGVEVRGRLVRLVFSRNRRTGVTRGHRVGLVSCTTTAIRKETLPGMQSCTMAPREPAASILCEKPQPCRPGTAPLVSRPQP